MRVPEETVSVDRTGDEFVATTSLVGGLAGKGSTESEAVANLNVAARSYLRMLRATGHEVPVPFRVPAGRRVLFVVLFLVGAAALPILVLHLWEALR